MAGCERDVMGCASRDVRFILRASRETFQRFFSDCEGSTAIEYGLIAGLMAVAAIAAFAQMGNGLVNLFGKTNSGAGAVIFDATGSI